PRARVLQGRRAVSIRRRHRRGSIGRLSVAVPPRGHHARARIGARRGLGDARGGGDEEDPNRRGRAVGARRQGCADHQPGPLRDRCREGDGVTRLRTTFAALRARGERALIPYFTAGDPSLPTTRELVVEASKRGADVVELGVPFSDPLADGPVIQRATQRALASGVTLARVLELVREIRRDVAVPLVRLTYYNPVLAFGLKAFCRAAGEAGVDAVMTADLPPEEAGDLRAEATPVGLDLIHFVAPTSTPERMRAIARATGGFIYM